MRLEGKQALVTAAGQGIGRASALARAAEGARVWATDVNPVLLEAFRGVANVTALPLDVLDRAAIAQLAEQLPALDALDSELEFAFNLNVRSQFWMIQSLLPKMLPRVSEGGGKGGASIINMASVAGSVKGLPNRFVYGTTKAAVIGLTKSVAADFVGQGIRCNAICPGRVDTPSLRDRINVFSDPAAARQNFIARQPMGRLAQAHEIAPLVVFQASDESAFVTGQAYGVDGGMTI